MKSQEGCECSTLRETHLRTLEPHHSAEDTARSQHTHIVLRTFVLIKPHLTEMWEAALHQRHDRIFVVRVDVLTRRICVLDGRAMQFVESVREQFQIAEKLLLPLRSR